MEKVGTIVVEWEGPKWKGLVQMLENGRIQDRKVMCRYGIMCGSQVETVCTDVGEWADRTRKR